MSNSPDETRENTRNFKTGVNMRLVTVTVDGRTICAVCGCPAVRTASGRRICGGSCPN